MKPGFLPATFGAHKPEDNGTLLKLAPGDNLTGLTIELFPGGAISGKILDPDNDPVADAPVSLWKRLQKHGVLSYQWAGETQSARNGDYLFEGLLPGAYCVKAKPPDSDGPQDEVPVDQSGKATRLRTTATYFPAALSREDAQPLRLESAEDIPGIDIHLQRTVALTVKGKIAVDPNTTSEYQVAVIFQEGNAQTAFGAKLLPNGNFEASGLPPGNYKLVLSHHTPNGSQPVGHADLTLTDQDVTGIQIAPLNPSQLRVRVFLENEPAKPLTNGQLSLLNQADNIYWPAGYAPKDGVYLFENVTPGKYQPWFNDTDIGYLKSIQVNGQILETQTLDVTEGTTSDITLLFSRNWAHVSGDADQPSAHILLIAEDESLPENLKQYHPELDQSSQFSIPKLRPGKYLAFAAEDNNPDLWDNPDFLKAIQSQGQEFECRENQTATLHLKRIPKDETAQIAKRL
jgi:hypothetical protein